MVVYYSFSLDDYTLYITLGLYVIRPSQIGWCYRDTLLYIVPHLSVYGRSCTSTNKGCVQIGMFLNIKDCTDVSISSGDCYQA